MKIAIKRQILHYIGIMATIVAAVAIISLILKYGFYMPDKWMTYLFIQDEVIACIFVITLLTSLILSENRWQFVKKSWFKFLLLLLFVISIIMEDIISPESAHYFLKATTSFGSIKLYFVIIQIYVIINAIIAITSNMEKWFFFSMSPARIMILSFTFVIFLGGLLLKLPKATYSPISWIDAFFTSTSAVCVTGLSTLNVSEAFTFKGQLIILLLIQIGGLGIITLTSFFALFIHQGIRLRNQIMVREIITSESFSSLTTIIKAIVMFTFIVELAGVIGLYLTWGNLGLSEFNRIFSAIFHSVSAYCNAGFSIFPQGLQTDGYNFSNISLIVLMIIIICGGLGFYTYTDILGIGKLKIIKSDGLTPQSKIILISTLILIVTGALLIWMIQFRQWRDLPFGKQVLNAFFLSIASRTAGFSIAEIGNIAIPAALVVIILMYIGGAPNSTAGGIKITTGVILLSSFRAFAKGKNRVEIGWNTIPMITVRRAFIVFIVSIILIFLALFILSATESFPFFDIFFEIFSAFSTTGLSRGITPELSGLSKLVLIFVSLLFSSLS